MTSLKEQLVSYGAYHRDPRNKLTHFLGVPLVTFSIFLFLSWFRLVYVPDGPVSAATLFFLVVFFYYLRLDWQVALLQAPVNLILLGLADRTALLPAGQSLSCFLAAFVAGWVIQLIGHAMEGRRPAFADNLLQIFNAPLFLTVEVLFVLGLRQDLRPAADQVSSEPAG
jgi:uncharacterized membrane protein YGL010W